MLVDTASNLTEYSVSFGRINGIMCTYARHFEVCAQCAEVVATERKCGCVGGMTFGGRDRILAVGFDVFDWLEHVNGTCRRDEKYWGIIHYVGFHSAITVIVCFLLYLSYSAEDTNRDDRHYTLTTIPTSKFSTKLITFLSPTTSIATAMPSTASPPTPISGIETLPTGDRHIPSSTRADGSLRKEIKIRPGYRPPEDVEVYKNRTAEAWKNRGTGGIPGAEGLKENGGGVGEEKAGGAAGKNAKRREARKRAKAAEGDEGGEEGQGEKVVNGANEKGGKEQSTAKLKAEESGNWREKEKESQADLEAEKEKQARNLKKKLRQARDLREKKDKGENLLPEQFEKVIKIQELIRQLEGLGFDSEGNRKEKVGDAE